MMNECGFVELRLIAHHRVGFFFFFLRSHVTESFA